MQVSYFVAVDDSSHSRRHAWYRDMSGWELSERSACKIVVYL